MYVVALPYMYGVITPSSSYPYTEVRLYLMVLTKLGAKDRVLELLQGKTGNQKHNFTFLKNQKCVCIAVMYSTYTV